MERGNGEDPATFDFTSEFQRLLAEDVIFSLRLRPDGSFEAYVGHYMSGLFAQRNIGTLEEATAWIREMAACVGDGMPQNQPPMHTSA